MIITPGGRWAKRNFSQGGKMQKGGGNVAPWAKTIYFKLFYAFL